MRALDDLRVLDLSTGVAGPFCAKLLGDFGAAVVKIEPPSGEPGRSLPPLIDGKLDANGEPLSAFFLYLNANKRGVTLSLENDEGRALLRRLVTGADIVVESFAPGYLETLGLGFDALEALKPGIILTSVTPYGQNGPWRELPGNDLTAYAASGWASINGWPEREPLKGSGYQASFQAGLAAFLATMAAVVHRDDHGVGQQVDVAMLDACVATFAPALLRTQYSGDPPGRVRGDFQRGPVPAADGHFSLTLSRAHFWRDAMNELGLPELAEDERWGEPSFREAHHHEVAELVQSRIALRQKRALFEALGRLRVVGGMVLDTAELHADPHVRARGFFVEQEHPEAGRLAYPGAPFTMSATPWALERPAPRLGEHTDVVLREAGLTVAEIATLHATGTV